MRGRWLGCLLGCGAVAGVGGLVGLALLWRWLSPPPGPETLPPPAAPPAHYDNTLAALADCIPEDTWQLRLEQGGLTPDAIAWLDLHQASFERLEAALQRPQCTWPSDDPAPDRTSERLQAAVRMWQAQALRAWEAGDLGAALAAAAAARQLAARAARGAQSLPDHAAATVAEAAALQTLHLLLRPSPAWSPAGAATGGRWVLPRLTPGDRRRWQTVLRDLLTWREEPAALQLALRADYHHAVARLRSSPWRERVVQDRRVKTAALLRNSALPRAQRAPARGWSAADPRLSRPWFAGHRANLPRWFDDRLARVRLTAAAIALRLYIDQHQRLPRGWTDLVGAKLLPAPPIDPATGQPPAWTVASGLLVGLGDNAKRDPQTASSSWPSNPAEVSGGDDVLVPLTFIRPSAAWESGK